MSCNLLSPVHIYKLGHPIEEIRTRALHSVWSKYNLDLVDDSNFENTKLLLMRLIDWFTFETHPYEEKVLKLIIRILGQINCTSVIRDLSLREISEKIDKIRIEVDGNYFPLIEEIKECLKKIEENLVPELHQQYVTSINKIEDVVLGQKELDQIKCFTAVKQDLPHDMKTANQDVIHKKEFFNFDNTENLRLPDKCKKNEIFATVNRNATKIEYFPWQLLLKNDSAVLPSIYDGVRYMDNIDSILQTCQFFTDILLQDFPTEILLQRPLLIQTFMELLQSNDSVVCLQATKCLTATVKHLKSRLHMFLNTSLIHSKGCYRGLILSSVYDSDENRFERDEAQKFLSVNNYSCNSEAEFEKEEAVLPLKSHQYAFSEICFLILSQSVPNLSKEKSLEEYNLIFELVLETFSCLIVNFTTIMWCNKQLKHRLFKAFNLFYGPMKYNKTKNNVIYSIIVHIIVKMLNLLQPPSEEYQEILPQCIQQELVECISDYIFILIHPNLIRKIKLIIDKFVGQRKKEGLEIHEASIQLCVSMKSAVEFLKCRNKLNTKVKILNCAQKALSSLEFHRNFQFIRDFVKICLLKWSEKELNVDELNIRKSILLKLLSHNDSGVKLNSYKELHTYVIRFLGVDEETKPKFKYSGDKFGFLFDSDVLIEMICHGINSDHNEIQNISNEIFIHILKGRIFFSDTSWKNLLKALSPCLCLLQCFADKTTALGRCVFKMLDPDITKTISLSSLDLLRGNLRLLFSKNKLIRDEALLRLFWLLTKEDPKKKKLPRLSLLRGINLNSICSSVEPEQFSRLTQPFFSADSLSNIMEMLTADGVEPRVRRSGLTQLSVMLEDSHLHNMFLEQNGLQIMLDIFKNCLVEMEFQNYPDSAVPVMKILRHICLDNPSIRIELSQNIALYYCILRGLLLFNSEKQSRQQGVELLWLLLYNECIINVKNESTIMCKISVPQILVNKICLPFLTHIHWRYSQYAEPSNRESIMLKEKSASLLRIYWNIEWFGSISQIIALKNNDLNEDIFSPSLPTDMMLKTEDLESIQNCSIPFGINRTLLDIQNATSHDVVVGSLYKLHSYLILYDLGRGLDQEEDDLNNFKETTAAITNMKWTCTFERFFSSMPSCEDDEVLLSQVIYNLRLVLKTLNSEDLYKWVENLLTVEMKTLQRVFTSCGECKSTLIYRNLTHALTELIKDTVTRNTDCLPSNWLLYIKLITRQLKLNKNHEFHNVAHVGDLLSVLADVTGRSTQNNVHSSDFYKETISRTMETIVAFHCAKYIQNSFFGKNVIQNCLIVLNNILNDTQATIEGWESLWHHALSDVTWHTEEPNYSWLLSLWFFRDPVIKALAVQLLSGFSLTCKSCELLLGKLHIDLQYLWNESIRILLDLSECNLVREKAALLLSNLICHGSVTTAKGYFQQLKENSLCETLCDIFDRVQMDASENESFETFIFQRHCDSSEAIVPMSTPSLIGAICILLINIMSLIPEEMGEIILRTGLLDYLKKVFNNASETCFKYKDKDYAIEIIKMYKNCCKIVTKCMTVNFEAYSSVRHFQLFINSIFSLMNYTIYGENSKIILDERNQLWCEILDALSVLLTEPLEANSEMKCLQVDGFKALNRAMTENGTDCFISTLYIAATSNSCELRFSCLRFLTNFFGIEVHKSNQFTITDVFDRHILSGAAEHAGKFCWKVLSISDKLDLNFGERMSDVLLQTYRITNHADRIALKVSVADALGSLFSICENAQNYCFDEGLADNIVESLRTIFIKLTMENAGCLKKSDDRQRVDAILLQIEISYRLLTNLLTGNEKIKSYAASNGLASLLHKLWYWCTVKNSLLVTALKLLSTYTFNSELACRSLALDKSWSVIGLRKPDGAATLIQAVMLHIEKEVNLISKNPTSESLQLSFQLLENCCQATECRCIIAKGTFIRCFANLYHGRFQKRRSQSEFIMELWYNFLVIFTSHQEGQLAVSRNQDALDAIIEAASTSSNCKKKPLKILRNLSFHQLNRVQLLGHYKFLSIIIEAVKSGDTEEINLALQGIWGLMCNSQKGKIIIRNTGLDDILKDITKKLKLSGVGEELPVINTISQILINK